MRQPTNPMFIRNGHGAGFGTNASITTGAWATANRALFIPATFDEPCQITAISFRPITAAGNYDIGLYRSDFSKIESKGSTACADADQTFTLATPRNVGASDLLYVGLVLSSISDSVVAQNVGAWVADRCGILEQAAALPLPDPFVPVLPASTWVPLIRFTVAGLPT